METIALLLVLTFPASAAYAYAAYPALLRLVAAVRGPYRLPAGEPAEWPTVSVSLPAYNEADVIGETLENLLALDYPSDRLQIVVISDASTDGTDGIVRSFADRGVELIVLEERGGKTRAENTAIPSLEGEVVVSADATVRLPADALRRLVRAFRDPTVGVASGRDRSVGPEERDVVVGESRYVSYEMRVRDLETSVGTIIGASGCFYGVRRRLHERLVPEELSRDFMAVLNARENGYRAVSVPDAVAFVPRAGDLRAEFRRKVRTMARGLDSLWVRRAHLSPFKDPLFAWMLWSHKLARWIVPLTLPLAVLGLGWLSVTGSDAARIALGSLAAFSLVGAAAHRWPRRRAVPFVVSACGYVAGGLAAGVVAWGKALARERKPIWEPTRREPVGSPDTDDS